MAVFFPGEEDSLLSVPVYFAATEVFQTAVNEHFRDTTPDCLGKAVKFDRHLSKDFKHVSSKHVTVFEGAPSDS